MYYVMVRKLLQNNVFQKLVCNSICMAMYQNENKQTKKNDKEYTHFKDTQIFQALGIQQ